MRILLLINILLPDAAEYLKKDMSVRGGWLVAASQMLSKEHELAVITVMENSQYCEFLVNKVQYYVLPTKNINKYQRDLENYFQMIKLRFSPDVIHIYGTEFPHSLAFVNACGNDRVVVSLQGLVSIYERYYLAGLSKREIWNNITLRDIIRRDNLLLRQREFKKRGMFEEELLRKVKYVEGRTSWDKTHSLYINNKLKYFHCNRTLRDSFYLSKKWQYVTCEKHSIFLSQCATALKGCHYVLMALPFILKEFPDCKLYVTNTLDLTRGKLKNRLLMNGYFLYLRKLIKTFKLEKNVIFTGMLDEKEMCKMYLKSNVFVCPSSIENSPNSVGEAQILGVPCIASYVGGNMDMVTDGVTGFLYRFEEVEMLAFKICDIFRLENKVSVISRQEIEVAEKRHDISVNYNKMMLIYNQVLND